MRVLHVIESMNRGGAETLVVEHVRHAAPDVRTLVVALNQGGPALAAAEALGAGALLLAKGGDAVLGRAQAIRALTRLMRDEGVTVVNGHNPVGALYGTLAARAAQVPVAIRTEHSIHYPGRHSGLYPVLEAATTLLVDHVVCVCAAARQSHVRRLPWAADRFVTILNGVSAGPEARARAAVRAELGIADDARVALTVGSLTAQKAQHVLIDAWSRVAATRPAARLLVAGDGPRRAALGESIRARGLEDRVRLLGARDDVVDLITAADLFVLSSVREGLSVTLLEAMRAGRPCVATAIGGNGEAIQDGETGALVPANDPAALAQALGALLDDPARAARMGAAGRDRWRQSFTAERMVGETEALYRRVLARSGRPEAGERSLAERRGA